MKLRTNNITISFSAHVHISNRCDTRWAVGACIGTVCSESLNAGMMNRYFSYADGFYYLSMVSTNQESYTRLLYASEMWRTVNMSRAVSPLNSAFCYFSYLIACNASLGNDTVGVSVWASDYLYASISIRWTVVPGGCWLGAIVLLLGMCCCVTAALCYDFTTGLLNFVGS